MSSTRRPALPPAGSRHTGAEKPPDPAGWQPGRNRRKLPCEDPSWRGETMPVDTDGLKQIFLALPEVREGITHGTLSFYLGKTFFGRMQEDGSSFALKMDFGDR